ncbi:MAG TPA: DUF445 domain-containing protein [Jiangellales bacterium]|nr:DUF445 domain-containing protein [Jiangellales bacterium]
MSTVVPLAPQPAAPGLPGDEERRRGLRRMKSVSGGLLVLAAVVYVVARRAEDAGAPGWVGFVRAAAEAGMIGGLADWFAVTALFRRPLGLPIPHTALIPARKDALGASLGDFVGGNFLAEDVVRARVRQAGVAGRVGAWVAVEPHAERVVAEAAVTVRGALEVLRDEDVQELLERTLLRPLAEAPVGPPLGQLLGRVVEDGSHHGLVDLSVDELRRWLVVNRSVVVNVVAAQAPAWSPRLLDDVVAGRVHAELLRFVEEVGRDPDHSFRRAVDRFLGQVALDLQHDVDTMRRADELKDRLLERDDVREATRRVWASVRRVLVDAVGDPGSDLRRRAVLGLQTLGRRVVEDDELRRKVDGWLEQAVVHVATNYRDELTAVISDTVRRWDVDETTRKIELQVGRDLQFIRVNGTLVGALVGVVIHGVSVWLL